MAKRRLSQQQQRRIADQIDKRRQTLEDDSAPGIRGLVIAHHGRTLIIEDETGKRITCTARQNIGQPVCGDRVIWHVIKDGEGVISAIEPRINLLERPGFADKLKPVAANITRIGIVVAPQPEPQEKLIDSYLVAAEHLGIRPFIVCNKTDLIDDKGSWQERFQVYRDIGYEWISTDAKHHQGIDLLSGLLNHQTSILVGQSGVGKSSLINCLLPDKRQATNQLSEGIQKGQHTTSYSELFQLANDGDSFLIDSPGVRDFRLGHIQPEDIAQGFIELRQYLGQCKFSNCQHQQEPDCAIRKAEAQGNIHPSRLQSYFEILTNN